MRIAIYARMLLRKFVNDVMLSTDEIVAAMYGTPFFFLYLSEEKLKQIRREIKTRKKEKKLKQHNGSFKRLIISFVQENQKEN